MDVEGNHCFSGRPGPEIFQAEPSRLAAVGEGDPAFSAGRGLMGPSLGVCRARPSLPAAPPRRGGGAELPRAGAGRAPRRVRAEGCGGGGGVSWPGCSPAPLRSAGTGTGQREGAGGLSGRPRRSGAWSLRLLAAPRTPLPRAVLRPARLFVSCEPRKPL